MVMLQQGIRDGLTRCGKPISDVTKARLATFDASQLFDEELSVCTGIASLWCPVLELAL